MVIGVFFFLCEISKAKRGFGSNSNSKNTLRTNYNKNKCLLFQIRQHKSLKDLK